MARDAYTLLIARPLFRFQEGLKRHDTTRRLREMEKSQWWDATALARYRVERLRRFLEHAGARVPHYREIFQSRGFRPDSIRGLEDLAQLPLLTKADISANRTSFVTEGATHLIPNQTGGSTGEPLQFFVGLERVTSDVASRCRAMRWWGMEVGDTEIVLWASPIEMTRQDRMRGLRDRILRSTLLAADKMSPEAMDRYLDTFERVRPVQIFSHGSALCELARHAEERGRSMSGLGVRVAFLTSEQLYDHQREQIERVFGCKVANGYGARDSGFVAHECPEGSMHLNAEDIILEVVDDRGAPVPAGRPGVIVVTNLASGDFPFLRYATGDVAVLEDAPCRCGRSLPVIREIHGRADDLLLGLDGTRVPGQAVVHLIRRLPSVKAFRVVQEAPDRIRILIVPMGEFPAGEKDGIVKGVQARLGSGMNVELVPVDDIPLEASGKYRTVLNKIGTGTSGPARR
ncbi:MAG: phenylacetate--CoA ligase family protein [Candidatus Eiseniibacteriota bacterium]